MSFEFTSYSDIFTREQAWKVPSRNSDAETVFSQVLYALWFSLFQTLRIGSAVVMSYKWRIYFPSWTDVIGSPNPSIIIKSIESHTKKTHLTAYNHRTSPSCFHEMVWIVSPLSYETLFVFTCKSHKKKKTSVYTWGSRTVRVLLITVFLACIFERDSFSQITKKNIFFLSRHLRINRSLQICRNDRWYKDKPLSWVIWGKLHNNLSSAAGRGL